MQKRKSERYIISIFLFISVISFFVCFNCNYKNKELLYLLPLGFGVISIIFFDNYKDITNNISKFIIQSLYFIRLSILPLLYSFNIEFQLFEGKASIDENFNLACKLMIYEFLAVQCMMYFYKHNIITLKVKRIHIKNGIDISKGLIICLTAYLVFIAIIFPQYKENFKSILSLTDVDFTVAFETVKYSVGSWGRILKTLFSIGFQIFRILFPAFLIRQLYELNPKNKCITLVMIGTCILQFSFLTSTFAEAIVSCLAIILYYIHLYPDRRGKTFLFLGVSTLGMIIIYFSIRYLVKTNVGMYSKDNGAVTYAAQIINAYFTGIDNVSAIFNIEKGHAYEAFIAGIKGAIPFNSTLFGARGNKLQYYFNSANKSYGQIPPTIGAGYYYFGILASPIISVLFVYFSLKYYEYSEKLGDSLKYIATIFCSIVFALGTVMYSPSITLSWFFSWGIPMILLTIFTGKDSINTFKGEHCEKSIEKYNG